MPYFNCTYRFLLSFMCLYSVYIPVLRWKHLSIVMVEILNDTIDKLCRTVSSLYLLCVCTLCSFNETALKLWILVWKDGSSWKEKRNNVCAPLHIYYPFFEDNFLSLMRFFQKILSLCMVSIQELFWSRPVMMAHVRYTFAFIKYQFTKTGQAGLEAVFHVPIPGDSGSSPDAGSISNYCLTQEIFHSNPSGILTQP